MKKKIIKVCKVLMKTMWTEQISADTLEDGDYSKEGGKLEGQDFDTHESTGDSALENDVPAKDI